MIRFLAKWRARRNYIWKEEIAGAEHELNAKAALQRFNKLTAEADAIEKRIAEVTEMEAKGFWACECGNEEAATASAEVERQIPKDCGKCQKPMKFLSRETMSGQEKYESDKARDEVAALLKSKRDDAAECQKSVQYFAKMAAQSREFADRLRNL